LDVRFCLQVRKKRIKSHQAKKPLCGQWLTQGTFPQKSPDHCEKSPVLRQCGAIRLRAERKAGELLVDMEKAEGGKPYQEPHLHCRGTAAAAASAGVAAAAGSRALLCQEEGIRQWLTYPRMERVSAAGPRKTAKACALK
jgi:hypothetical protein